MPKSNVGKILFVIAIIVTIVGIISQIDSTLYYNATQYVPDGEKPDPVRVTEILDDVVQPFFNGAVLYALALLVDRRKAKD